MLWKHLAAAAWLVQDAAAQNINVGRLLRFSCSQLVIERTDPLVNPGVNPSPHTHQIVGGNSFNVTMDPIRMDPAAESTCTSCTYAEDFSNYWTASLYFKSPENGTYKLVPQATNFVGIDDEAQPKGGGLTIYYMTPFRSTDQRTTAFKPGFRMITGNPDLRSKNGTLAGICHRCNGGGVRVQAAPCDSADTTEFPTRICPGGIRASVIFPTCWDGKNLDSPDHRSHMAYSPSSGTLAGASCPSSHPVRVPQLMYEVLWNTSSFSDPKYFEGGKQPFVYSFGDATGYGQHGDYIFGWKGDALQRGMDATLGSDCVNDICSALKSQSSKDAVNCIKKTQVPNEIVGRGGECKLNPDRFFLTVTRF
ncbi:hypothetical protein B0T25DRAFT_619642 [Lasiosphaeria hispida]|uniref:DUF1996 domain-containing protein n=1 Tax=Lasiosphaeria hispida TaxID=260671 RepID=A0AAJ0HTG3_9PEZI|nr:hypothetical protein B0T25DRAFT_619642 [Lasiosphaeria hispida]